MMRAFAIAAVLLVGGSALEVRNATSPVLGSLDEAMSIMPRGFVEVALGPFDSASEACDYCSGSFTKKGDPPAGPVAPFCVCMSYPSDGGHTMFCATPPSAAKYVASKDGCRCKFKDMEAMGKTTCSPL